MSNKARTRAIRRANGLAKRMRHALDFEELHALRVAYVRAYRSVKL